MNKKLIIRHLLIIVIIILIIIFYFKKRKYIVIEGLAQGTTYRIIYQHPDNINLKSSIDSIFNVIDYTFSIYNKNSLLSKLNNSNEDTIILDNEHLKNLLKLSFRINEITNGAFDITLKPLIDAYGFGSEKQVNNINYSLIDSLKQFVGIDKIILKDNFFIKKNDNIQIDLNAIAQGYTCDIIADFFNKLKLKNYLIEVGGEIRTKGLSPKNKKWAIGIDYPDENNTIPGANLESIVYISNISIATSGNYRKFYVDSSNNKFTHIIDPITGLPAKTDILSVTVFYDTCAVADALATAFMVMGFDKTLNFLKNHSEFSTHIIYYDNSMKKIRTWTSENIKKSLKRIRS